MTTTTISRLPEVLARTGLSRSTIYAKIKAGEFPPQINLGLRAVGWRADEVDQWINDRINDSRPGDDE